MSQQVITIQPDGTMSGLQVKPGKGVDLTKLGKASVVRASEILWDDMKQGWYVDVIQSAGKGPLTTTKWREAGLEGFPQGATCSGLPGSLYWFADYDTAVKAEIAYLDALRLKGQF